MPSTHTFSTPGNHDWIVPAGVTLVRLDLRGASGAPGSSDYHTDGMAKGGRVFGAFLSVTPTESLRFSVGGVALQGTEDTPAHGGGGAGSSAGDIRSGAGGGATDVRQGGTALSNRKIVAGGGGGRGVENENIGDEAFGYQGGQGGANTGQDGFDGGRGVKGRGGTQSSGGAGGTNEGAANSGSGSLGLGGAAVTGLATARGGGGGGGYFGGGGGGSKVFESAVGAGTNAGGGGGSNFVGSGVMGATSVRGHQLLNGAATVEWNLKPVVDVTGPTGIVTETSQPTVTWDYIDAEGDAQASFRVVVRQDPAGANTVVYDSGFVSSSENSHELPALDNGHDYEVDVTVRQVASGIENDESDPDTSAFSLDLNTPDAPTLTLTPEPNNARMVIEVDDPTVDPDPVTEWFVVEFSDVGMDGPWTPVRGGSRVDAPGPVVLYDYENRFNSERWYRARSFYEESGQDIGSSSTIDSEQLVVDKAVVWITDPLDPNSIHMTVQPTAERERTWQGREIVHTPADMDFSVVESEVATRQDSISFLAVDPAAHDNLVKLFLSGRTLLYRDDRREYFYFRWAGDRGRRQVGGRRLDADIFTASQVIVNRPSS